MVLMLIASSAVLGHFIAITNMPQAAADCIVGLPLSRTVIMVIIFLVYLLGGSFVDDLAFMILATPIFFPIILKLGYDPLWAGIMLTCTVCIGAVIPPVALCVFIVRNVTKQPMSLIYKGVYPFLGSMILCMILLFIFPQLATYLPSVLMK
jgi:TRAP-type C4-dicarboxylate transport system permease large subunit